MKRNEKKEERRELEGKEGRKEEELKEGRENKRWYKVFINYCVFFNFKIYSGL